MNNTNNKAKNESSLEEIMGVFIPSPANYQLADIDLLNEWQDYTDRVIKIQADIDDYTMRYVNMIYRWAREDERNKVPKKDIKPLVILISSWGGDLHVCYAMIAAMKAYKGKIITVNMSVACSAAALIFICGTKGYRYMSKYAYTLLHQGSSSGGWGTFDQQESAQQNYRKLIDMLGEIILSNTTIDPKAWKKVQGKENYYYLQDCLDMGICDKELSDFSQIWK